ncbi:MAG: hypothetical protein ACYDBJ_00640 [Aggregatilineales bacterium]
MATALQAKPTLTVALYPFGIILRRTLDDGGETEYAISPAQLAETLCGQVRFESGLLPGNTLALVSEGAKKLIVEYRLPTKTALYLDGSETPVVVPLPGLVLARLTTGNAAPRYGVYAVKQRPETVNTPLFHAPLPNTGHGSVCWGSVKQPSAAGLASNRLDEDWKLLLGSVFTNHSVAGKSIGAPNDVRQLLIALDQRKARRYPVSDLIPLKATFGQLLKEGVQ